MARTVYVSRIPKILSSFDQNVQDVVHLNAIAIESRASTVYPYQRRSGNLAGSGSVEFGDLSATVGFGAEYAAFVELGTTRNAPYPFLVPAVDYQEPTYLKQLNAVVKSA